MTQITLNIESQRVKVDPSFMDLSSAEQEATVEEIAASLGSQNRGFMPQLNQGFAESADAICAVWMDAPPLPAFAPWFAARMRAAISIKRLGERGESPPMSPADCLLARSFISSPPIVRKRVISASAIADLRALRFGAEWVRLFHLWRQV